MLNWQTLAGIPISSMVLLATIAVAIVFLLLGVTLDELWINQTSPDSEDRGIRVPVWERGNLEYITNKIMDL